MNQYYIARIPYSGELYHHGIVGQKWGIRRYQNSDGTLTTAGKLRYGVKKAGEAIGKAAKATGKAATKVGKKAGNALVKAIKKRHPSLMTDDELRAARARLELENSYKESMRKLKSSKFSHRAADTIATFAKDGAKNLITETGKKAADSLAKRLLENPYERENRVLQDRIQLEKTQKAFNEKNYLNKDGNDSNKTDKNEKTIKRDDPIQKAVDNINKARMDRNLEEAKAKAEEIIKKRRETDEDIKKHRKEDERRQWFSNLDFDNM